MKDSDYAWLRLALNERIHNQPNKTTDYVDGVETTNYDVGIRDVPDVPAIIRQGVAACSVYRLAPDFSQYHWPLQAMVMQLVPSFVCPDVQDDIPTNSGTISVCKNLPFAPPTLNYGFQKFIGLPTGFDGKGRFTGIPERVRDLQYAVGFPFLCGAFGDVVAPDPSPVERNIRGVHSVGRIIQDLDHPIVTPPISLPAPAGHAVDRHTNLIIAEHFNETADAINGLNTVWFSGTSTGLEVGNMTKLADGWAWGTKDQAWANAVAAFNAASWSPGVMPQPNPVYPAAYFYIYGVTRTDAGTGDQFWRFYIEASQGIFNFDLSRLVLPITDAAICLKLVVIKDVGIGIFEPLYVRYFVFLLLSSVIWTGIGVICFKAMERWSRSKGTLGAY